MGKQNIPEDPEDELAGFVTFYPQNSRWIQSEDARLREMVASGESLENIAERLNRPISGVERRCRMLDLPRPLANRDG